MSLKGCCHYVISHLKINKTEIIAKTKVERKKKLVIFNNLVLEFKIELNLIFLSIMWNLKYNNKYHTHTHPHTHTFERNIL